MTAPAWPAGLHPGRCPVWEPGRVLGWSGRTSGGYGHHRWLLVPAAGGTLVRTEEVQAGLLPSLGRWWLRRSLLRWHQRWLDGLLDVA